MRFDFSKLRLSAVFSILVLINLWRFMSHLKEDGFPLKWTEITNINLLTGLAIGAVIPVAIFFIFFVLCFNVPRVIVSNDDTFSYIKFFSNELKSFYWDDLHGFVVKSWVIRFSTIEENYFLIPLLLRKMDRLKLYEYISRKCDRMARKEIQ